jgi:hypothetical protein
MLVALLALFVSLAGSSYAALKLPKGSVGTRQLKKNAVTSPKVKPGTLLLSDFRASQRRKLRGAQGGQGARGLQGPKGDAGADGATGSALLSGVADGISSVSPGTTIFRRASPTGYSAIAVNPGDRATLSPGRALVFRDLAARTLNDLPAGGSVQVQLYVDQAPLLNEGAEDATLACTVTGTDGTDDRGCTAAGPVSVPAASTLFVRLVVAGGTSANTNPGPVRWGITAEPAG